MAENYNYSGYTQKRVFINDLDSYASKNIAAVMSECRLLSAYDQDEVDEQQKSFRVVGSAGGPDGRAAEGRAADGGGPGGGGPDRDGPSPSEEHSKPDRNELLLKMMECDVIIYNIVDHADQLEEAFWSVTALHNQREHFSAPKMFILISTVMTWAHTEALDPEDPTLPLTDEVFWRRRPHANFKSQCELEKRVVKLGKTDKAVFSTYVLASGCLYGKEEQFLHYFFKTAWLGGQEKIPLFGDGSNIIPTIHVSDLANVIQNVIERPPLPSYLLAVDNSHDTLEDIVEAVTCELGSGKIQKKPIEEAFLIPDFSVMEIDTLQLDLFMESVYVRELLAVKWLYESGLVENIERVVEEYRLSRQLLPIRVCVLGAPAVGKSAVCEHLCQRYKLHHVSLKEVVSETISQLEEVMSNPHAEEEAQEEAEELLAILRGSLKTGVLEEHLKVKVVKDKLLSKPCRNQGFVLDGFPETRDQARELFYYDAEDSEDATFSILSRRQKIIPEFVFCLEASDKFLKNRVKNLPQSVIQERNYEQEPFLQRLAKHREENLKTETALEYFEDMDISPVVMEITSNNKSDFLLLMRELFEVIGQPRNYDPSAQDGQQEEGGADDDGSLALWEERQREKKQQRAENALKWNKAEGLSQLNDCCSEFLSRFPGLKRPSLLWVRPQRPPVASLSMTDLSSFVEMSERPEKEPKTKMEKIKLQEDELLEAQAVPVRNYLLEHVMPTLSQGLVQCCQSQPQDPVDFLAEYLLMNNPFNY